MSDTPTPNPLPTETASPKRASTILGRLAQAVREQNWFAVVLEVAIVVLGVVIGFQVTAWGQARADADREGRYLRQLHADLVETERDIRTVDSLMAPQARSGTRLVRAFFLPEEPPEDSLIAWFRGATQTLYVRPVVATEEALVSTGNLTLIRDDSLRSAITAHLEVVRRTLYVQDDMLSRWAVPFTALISRLDPVAFDAHGRTPAQVDSLRRDPLWPIPATPRDRFPFDVSAFLADQDAYNDAEIMRNVRLQLRGRRAWLLRETIALREQVEAELDR